MIVIGAVTVVAVRDDDAPNTSASACPASSGSETDSTLPTVGSLADPGIAKVGDVAPDFVLQTFECSTVRLSDFRGTPVVLNFWASYCEPCREEFPLLRSADQDADGKYAVVGVDFEGIRDDGLGFARDQDATWPNGFDPTGSVAARYGVGPLPQTMFIDADGTISARVAGPLTRTVLTQKLAQLARGR